jgi:methylated-DNA-[protein]-cysteine S-methyltransferase
MPSLTVSSPLGPLTLHEEDGVLTALDWEEERADAAEAGDETALLTTAAQQLNAYFFSELRAFELPLGPHGTRHQRRVWRHMLDIPYGETRTYGEFARDLHSGPRAVGAACGRNPLPIIVPCHRVAAADGSLGGYSGRGGLATKRFLLELEGARALPGPLFERR